MGNEVNLLLFYVLCNGKVACYRRPIGFDVLIFQERKCHIKAQLCTVFGYNYTLQYLLSDTEKSLAKVKMTSKEWMMLFPAI